MSLPNNAEAAPTPALQPPYNTVVRINETIDGNGWQGSGVLISPDEVLTANHISYKSGDGGHTATDIQVVPGYQDGNAPLGTYTGTVAHYFPVENEPFITYANMATDYSIIHLDKPVIGASIAQLTADYAGGQVHITGYPLSGGNSQIDSVQTITSDPNYSIYESAPLGDGSSGAPLWYDANGTMTVVGLVSAVSGSTAYDVKLTADKVAQIKTWVATDDANLVVAGPVAPPVVVPPVTPPAATDPTPVVDTNPPVVTPPVDVPITPSAPVTDPVPPVVQPPVTPPPASPVSICDAAGNAIADVLSKAYNGPVAGILKEYVDINSHSINVAGNVAGLFIHTGQGNDAVALHGGVNVVDGGTGSNFLTAGTGLDTFFVDARNAASDIWSTVKDLHSGGAATVWGISATDSMQWLDGQGAASAKGLTLNSRHGGVNASLTLAGFSKSDLAAGKLAASFGHDPASGADYLYVKAV